MDTQRARIRRQQAAAVKALGELAVGDLVWYQPYPNARRYAAEVGGEVREVGGTPCVYLVKVERDYGVDCHAGADRTTVPAAALFALTRRIADRA